MMCFNVLAFALLTVFGTLANPSETPAKTLCGNHNKIELLAKTGFTVNNARLIYMAGVEASGVKRVMNSFFAPCFTPLQADSEGFRKCVQYEYSIDENVSDQMERMKRQVKHRDSHVYIISNSFGAGPLIPIANMTESLEVDFRVIVLLSSLGSMLQTVAQQSREEGGLRLTIDDLICSASELIAAMTAMSPAFYYCVDEDNLTPDAQAEVVQQLHEFIHPTIDDDMYALMKVQLRNSLNNNSATNASLWGPFGSSRLGLLQEKMQLMRQICSDASNIQRTLQKTRHLKRPVRFVHITKTGGSNLEDMAMLHNIPWGRADYEHGWHHAVPSARSPARMLVYDWFMIVRNPFDRCLSEYHSTHWQSKQKETHTKEQMNEFISNALKGVGSQRWLHGEHFTEQFRYNINLHPNVTLHVLHFENLTMEFDALMMQYDLPLRFTVQDLSQSDKQHYVSYRFGVRDLSSATITLIQRIYNEDFVRFNYSFDPVHAVHWSDGEYDCQSYLDRYLDLRTAYGSNCNDPETARNAFSHWGNLGKREGRNGSPSRP